MRTESSPPLMITGKTSGDGDAFLWPIGWVLPGGKGGGAIGTSVIWPDAMSVDNPTPVCHPILPTCASRQNKRFLLIAPRYKSLNVRTWALCGLSGSPSKSVSDESYYCCAAKKCRLIVDYRRHHGQDSSLIVAGKSGEGERV